MHLHLSSNFKGSGGILFLGTCITDLLFTPTLLVTIVACDVVLKNSPPVCTGVSSCCKQVARLLLLLLLFIILLVTMHAWVSFEATAEVYNKVCRDGCINNVTKLKHFLRLHPVITKNTDHGMNKPIFYV